MLTIATTTIWDDHANDALLTTVAQVLPVFLLLLIADVVTLRFGRGRFRRWMVLVNMLTISQLMIGEFTIVMDLSIPQYLRPASWHALGQLLLTMLLSGILLTARVGAVLNQWDSEDAATPRPMQPRVPSNQRRRKNKKKR